MSALRTAHGVWRGEHLVMPRLLRRPLRLVVRLCSGRIVFPRYSATMASGLLFAAAGLYGMAAGGHVDDVVQGVSSHGGFAISDVNVTGNHETSEIDILQKVGLDGWTSLMGFDAAEARHRIAELPWVASASVRKVYPATLNVKIVEKHPYAIWQLGDDLTIVEKSGEAIAPYAGGHFAALPLLIGQGAEDDGPEFLARIRKYPELASRIKAYVRVGQRRWNLLLENGITVKLPENDEDGAIASLVQLDRDHGLLSRDILAVDMRIADRLVVKLTPETVEKRDAAVQREIKNRGKRGTNI